MLTPEILAYGFQTKRFVLNYMDFNKSSNQGMQSRMDVLATYPDCLEFKVI